ncbi:MAG: DEAD/DEAH box helicase [bacterium]|nr:DEAD/DEAH box helicase [bacterium]
MSSSAFLKLHPAIQEQLYSMNWGELRPIQVEAINKIFLSEDHLVIAAQTASGKTEAAFLPLLSQLLSNPVSGLGAVYIGPLKALINDQFSRLEILCQKSDIAVHRWHGDVSAAQKRKLVEDPSGVLLITPESMESLLINKTAKLAAMFGETRFVVVDELHSFIGNSRGQQLLSQWARLRWALKCAPRWVGLSATLGDLQLAGKWMRPNEPVSLIEDLQEGRNVALSLQGYLHPPTEISRNPSKIISPATNATDEKMALDLFNQFKNEKALIFGNSKQKLEYYADQVRRIAQAQNHPNPFFVHHGSLARSEREDVEAALHKDRPTAVFCSSTLEMGIDVGQLSLVGQLDAPHSVNSLVQRLGRSGRKSGDTAKLRVLIDEATATVQNSLDRRLYPRLLQAYAMIELTLDKWCEPPNAEQLDFSTLIQQILSLIAQTGGLPAISVYHVLVTHGVFSKVNSSEFAFLLKALGEKHLIEQMPEGDLILGIDGEKLVRSFEFYATFASGDEYRVVHQGRHIGSVSAQPGTGGDGYLILAGRRWKILEVREKEGIIMVLPAQSGKLPNFQGTMWFDLAPEVVLKAQELLFGDHQPAYFNQTARHMLSSLRQVAQDFGIQQNPFVLEGKKTYWFPWAGSRCQRTLMGMCKYWGGLDVTEESFCLIFDGASPVQIKDQLKSLAKQSPNPVELASLFPMKGLLKYDEFLPEDLLNRQFAANHLNMLQAIEVIKHL